MRFGKTWQQRGEYRNIRLSRLAGKVKLFAWFPVQLNDKNWAWLEYVMADYGVYEYSSGRFDTSYKNPIYYPID